MFLPAFAVALAVIQAAEVRFLSSVSGDALGWGKALRVTLLFYCYWAVLSPLLYAVIRRYPLSRPYWLKRCWIYVGLFLAVSLAYSGIRAFFGPAGLADERTGGAVSTLKGQFVGNLAEGALTFAVVVGLSHAILFYEQLRQRQVQESELKAELAQARLQSLQMQIHPHFLFNALNSIAATVRNAPDVAEQMIEDVGDLLQATFRVGDVQVVPLRTELELVSKYLRIQSVRFGDRFSSTREISEDALDCLVPSFILQILVENAVKHGASPISRLHRVLIQVSRENNQLRLWVEDNGPGFEANAQATLEKGVGLTNLHSRLKQLYGNDGFALDLENRESGGAAVRVTIPARDGRGDRMAGDQEGGRANLHPHR